MESISYLIIAALVAYMARNLYYAVKSNLPETEEIHWVDSKLDLISALTSGDNGELFPTSSDFYESFVRRPEIRLELMSQHIKLEGITLTFEQSQATPGLIQGGKHIRISREMAGKKYAMGAIMAHELAHAYMHKKQFPQIYSDNEKLTDMCAVYLGFGKFLLNGNMTALLGVVQNPFGNTLLISQSHIGYLSSAGLVYVYGKFCEGNGVPLVKRLAGLRCEVLIKVLLQTVFIGGKKALGAHRGR